MFLYDECPVCLSLSAFATMCLILLPGRRKVQTAGMNCMCRDAHQGGQSHGRFQYTHVQRTFRCQDICEHRQTLTYNAIPVASCSWG